LFLTRYWQRNANRIARNYGKLRKNELEAIQQQVARRKKILRKDETALKVGRVVNRFKMAKHFAPPSKTDDSMTSAGRRFGKQGYWTGFL